ncbi:MAG: kinase-like domain-containing protein [Monoraphidium minutum]|nr:MAG: kinase-like domain-containing protein [Monoraphidium minutum]
MVGRQARKHRHHGGYSDDEDGGGPHTPPPRTPTPVARPLGGRGGGAAPKAAAPPCAPPGARVGVELTPQQVAAATTGKRTRVIGVGGFGKVYAAQLPPPLGRVALKVAAPGGERALAAEALHLRRAAHPAVVRALGSCWAPGCAALALEQLPGGCLDDLIGAAPGGKAAGRRPPLTWRARLRAAYQVASALAYLHGALHIVHCDVKPGNVLLDAAGNAVLIDFGVARPITGDPHAAAAAAAGASGPQHPHHPHGAGHPTPAARAGAGGGAAAHLRALAAGVASGGVAQLHGWCGTRDYLDPLFEQLGQLCEKSDVYSLGVIMAQLLLDSPEPRDAKRIVAHHVKARELALPPATRDWPRASALAFGAAALRCCSSGDRDARPSAAELAAELRSLLAAAGEPGLARLEAGTLRLAAAVTAGGSGGSAAAAARARACGSPTPPRSLGAAAAAAAGGAAQGAAAAARVVCLSVELLPGGAARGVATVQVPPPQLSAPGAAPAAAAAEPREVAVAGEWDAASGRLRLAAAAPEQAPAKGAAGRRPLEFAGSYAAGRLEGTWSYQAGGAQAAALPTREAAAFWFVSCVPAPAPEPEPPALGAAAVSVAEAAAAALAEGLAAAAVVGHSGSRGGSGRCSRNALVERSNSLVRAV